jgi:type II secretory pathway component GspD/PulD (secretin)
MNHILVMLSLTFVLLLVGCNQEKVKKDLGKEKKKSEDSQSTQLAQAPTSHLSQKAPGTGTPGNMSFYVDDEDQESKRYRNDGYDYQNEDQEYKRGRQVDVDTWEGSAPSYNPPPVNPPQDPPQWNPPPVNPPQDPPQWNPPPVDNSMLSGEKMAQVERLLAQAKQDLAARNLEQARANLEAVLALDPGNAEALALLRDLGYHEGTRSGELQSVTQQLELQKKVKIQQAQVEAKNRFEQGKKHYADKEFEEAIRAFEGVLEIIKWAPYNLNLSDIKEQSIEFIRLAKGKKREYEQLERERKTQEARELALEEELKRQQALRVKIRTLFNKGTIHFERQEFRKAEELANQILEIEPSNRYARRLRDDSVQAAHRKFQKDYMIAKAEGWKRFREDMMETRIPYTQLISYPTKEKWAEISKREVVRAQIVEEDDPPEVQAIKRSLENERITLDFQDTPFQDVISFIRNVSSVNIVIDPEALEEDSSEVTLTVNDIKLKSALNILLQFKNLTYVFKDNVLFITRPDSAAARGLPKPELHDVRDLTGAVTDFPGMKIVLESDSGEDSGPGSALFEEEPAPAISEEDLSTLITESIAKETWDDEGNSIAISSGQLLVVHTPDVQNEIRRFLNDLREFSGLMVNVETRFIAATDDFLEDVGVDLRGIGDNNGFPGITGGRNSRFIEDVTVAAEDNASNAVAFSDNFGGANLPIGSVPVAGAYFNDGSSGDLRARNENIFSPGRGLGQRLDDTGGISLQFGFFDDLELNFVLRAVQKSSRATTMTAPRLTVFNTQRANVAIITQLAYVSDFDVEIAQSATIADPIIDTINEGLVLDVRPVISNDRKYVTLELRPTVAVIQPGQGGQRIREFQTSLGSSPGGGTGVVTIQVPELSVQRVETTVRVPDGGTVVIGGLKNVLLQDRKTDIPWLGDIPLLSFFFSRKGKAEELRNLMVLVTANIIDLKEQEELQVGRND